MSPREIIELQRERPFPGLRIHVSDGASYEVRHPELMLVTPGRVYIALPPLRDGVPAGSAVYCDPMHITRIEPMNGEKPKRAARRR